MKKKYIICLIIMILFTTACGSNTKLEESISKISLTGDLVTKKVYYHNVADFDGSRSNFFLRLFGIDKKAWIEYTGLTDLSIDLTKVKITADGRKIHVVIPKTTIHKAYVMNEREDDIIFYTSDGKIFNFGSVSSSEGVEALSLAQNAMYEAVKKDTSLLRMAQIRAKGIIEEKIVELAKEADVTYTIDWTYEENE